MGYSEEKQPAANQVQTEKHNGERNGIQAFLSGGSVSQPVFETAVSGLEPSAVRQQIRQRRHETDQAGIVKGHRRQDKERMLQTGQRREAE